MNFKFVALISAVVLWAIISSTFEEKSIAKRSKRFLANIVCILIVLISLLAVVHLFAFAFIWAA